MQHLIGCAREPEQSSEKNEATLLVEKLTIGLLAGETFLGRNRDGRRQGRRMNGEMGN